VGRKLTAVLAACAVAALAGAALAAHVDDTIIGRKSASGRHPSATTLAATGPHPGGVYVRVRATPNQRTTGGWATSCSLGIAGSVRDGDNFGGRTPLTVRVRVPTDLASFSVPCKIVGTAALKGRGRVTVELLVRR